MANFGDYPEDFIFYSGDWGLESPGLNGRVDSTVNDNFLLLPPLPLLFSHFKS